jgi:hypothetical protein
LRKHRINSGLIRTDAYDWPTQAREMLNAEKPDFVVMMIGLGDRRGIREAIKPQPARPPAGQKQAPAQPAQTQPAQPAQQAAAPATPVPQPAPAKACGHRSAGGARAGVRPGPGSAEHHRARKRDGGHRWCTNSVRRNGASFTRSASMK